MTQRVFGLLGRLSLEAEAEAEAMNMAIGYRQIVDSSGRLSSSGFRFPSSSFVVRSHTLFQGRVTPKVRFT